MRYFGLGVLVLGATACSASSMQFEHQSELPVTTRGVAISDAGTDAVAGMFGTTCRVAVSDGSIGEDYDFPTDSERVVDHGTMFGENAVLVISDVGAHATFPDRVWDWSSDNYQSNGVIDGRLWNDGAVVLEDAQGSGCVASWLVGGDVTQVSLSASTCQDATVAVDRVDGTLFVGAGADIVKVTPEGGSVIAHDGDLVAWDRVAQVLYTAQTGDSMLYGLEIDGSVRWEVDLGAAIVAMDVMGSLGKVAVMASNASGTGSLITVDGLTGEIVSTLATPEAADAVQVSASGNAMALVLPREVHFFRVQNTEF